MPRQIHGIDTPLQADPALDKSALRREMLRRRDALDPGRRIEAAFTIAERAIEAIPAEAGIVAAYLPIRSEVDPRPLMMAVKDRRQRLCVSAILPGGHLEFRELLADTELEPQGLGTVAPKAGTPVLRPEVVLVPLVAFDASGNRLGYGRGFYDRALESLRGDGGACLAIGLAYAAQEVPQVPVEDFDRHLDLIVTEAATIRPPARSTP